MAKIKHVEIYHAKIKERENSQSTVLHHSLSSSTRGNYSTGFRQFTSFCAHHNVPSLPATKLTVTFFAVSLSTRLTPSTIRVYIAAIGATHRKHVLPDPTRHNIQLSLVLQAIPRSTLPTLSKRRKPITEWASSQCPPPLVSTKGIIRPHPTWLYTGGSSLLSSRGKKPISSIVVILSASTKPLHHPFARCSTWGPTLHHCHRHLGLSSHVRWTATDTTQMPPLPTSDPQTLRLWPQPVQYSQFPHWCSHHCSPGGSYSVHHPVSWSVEEQRCPHLHSPLADYMNKHSVS